MFPSCPDPDGVYVDVEFVSLEKEDRHVFGPEGSLFVSDVHAYTIQEMVAVGLDYDLPVGVGKRLSRRGCRGRLGRWGECTSGCCNKNI